MQTRTVARVPLHVAQARKLLTPDAIAALSDEQALDLIFLPGFSTAAAVTELSGRGVGMDAVRSAVARLGGHVDVRTVLGRGTTVRFTLPFSEMMTTNVGRDMNSSLGPVGNAAYAAMSIGTDYAAGNPFLFSFLVVAAILFMLMLRS